MMCRRTPLPLHGYFLLYYTPVVIATNHNTILRMASKAGFVPIEDTDPGSAIRWEIVGTPGSSFIGYEECDVTLGDHSLYLSMGPEQWFAFDLETHDGAGFLAVADSDPSCDTNAQRYLSSIACYVGASLQPELEKSYCD